MSDKMKLVKHIAELGQNYRMSKFQLNIISWFNRPAKFDLRYWTEDKADSKAGGMTFSLEELRGLKRTLNTIDLENLKEDFSNIDECLNAQPPTTTETKEEINDSLGVVLPWD